MDPQRQHGKDRTKGLIRGGRVISTENSLNLCDEDSGERILVEFRDQNLLYELKLSQDYEKSDYIRVCYIR